MTIACRTASARHATAGVNGGSRAQRPLPLYVPMAYSAAFFYHILRLLSSPRPGSRDWHAQDGGQRHGAGRWDRPTSGRKWCGEGEKKRSEGTRASRTANALPPLTLRQAQGERLGRRRQAQKWPCRSPCHRRAAFGDSRDGATGKREPRTGWQRRGESGKKEGPPTWSGGPLVQPIQSSYGSK